MRATSPGRSIHGSTSAIHEIVRGVFVASLLLVGALSLTVRDRGVARSAASPGVGVLYTLDRPSRPSDPVRFLPLDSVTLAGRPDLPVREFARDTSWAFFTDWALSADGSTYLGVKYGWEDTAAISSNRPAQTIFVVRDARTGEERSRLRVDGRVALERLSDDGSRLLLAQRADRTLVQWSAYATSTGQLLATWSGEDLDVGTDAIALDDRRAYLLTAAPGPNPPPLAQVVAYDLQTGAEIGRRRLDDVVAGTWSTGRSAQGIPRRQRRAPGLALSPDGRQLVVVDADAARLTLLDADPLRLARSIVLTQPTSWLDWLPLFPRRVAAKGLEGEEEGAWARAVYGRDGARLYVDSRSVTLDERGNPTIRDHGLAIVDLDQGTVRAAALTGSPILAVVPSREGSDVYVVTDNQRGTTPYLVLRLDAGSLAERARREVTTSQIWLAELPR